MLEATIVMPMVISLLAGGVDFGLIMSTQATAKKSVRDAARYLATVPANAVCDPVNPWGLKNAKSLAVYGKLGGVDGVNTPLISGWSMNGGSNNNVQLGPDTTSCANLLAGNCSTGCVIQLQASIPYNAIFLSTILPNVSSWTLSAEHEERYVGG
jgi:hypothetical protein